MGTFLSLSIRYGGPGDLAALPLLLQPTGAAAQQHRVRCDGRSATSEDAAGVLPRLSRCWTPPRPQGLCLGSLAPRERGRQGLG